MKSDLQFQSPTKSLISSIIERKIADDSDDFPSSEADDEVKNGGSESEDDEVRSRDDGEVAANQQNSAAEIPSKADDDDRDLAKVILSQAEEMREIKDPEVCF